MIIAFFSKKSPFGEKKGRPRPLEQHRIRPQNLQKTTQNPPKSGPGAAPGRPGDAPGAPGPVLEVLDLSWRSCTCPGGPIPPARKKQIPEKNVF